MNVILFTKDRPLQCRAAIESFLFYSDFLQNQNNFYIISPEEQEGSYKDIIEEFSSFIWINEKDLGFDKTLRNLINSFDTENHTLFICDDQIFTRFYRTDHAIKYLEQNQEILGFSLRLGINIQPHPKFYSKNQESNIIFWHWPSTNIPHYNTVFELMHTIYRNNLLQKLLDENQEEMKCPNFYESFGTQYAWKNLAQTMPFMAMYKGFNNTVAQDVNMCQNYFNNKTQGDNNQNLKYLEELYLAGYRFDWSNLTNIIPNDIFVGNKYWSIYKK